MALSALCALLGTTGGGAVAGGSAGPAAEVPTPVLIEAAVAGEAEPVRPLPSPDGPEPFVQELPWEAVEIASVGDVNLGARVGDSIRVRGPDHPWSGVADLLRSADVAVVNLECTVSARGRPQDKEFTFRAHPDSLAGMRRAGVDVASIANNHAADFGREALTDTVHHLRGAGIDPVGGGEDVDEAWAPLYVSARGISIGFVSATRVLPHNFAATPSLPGVASAYDEPRLVAAVREAGQRSDVVIVLLHWGTETHTQPNGIQERLARALAREGADAIIGHHPHRLQPVERVGGAVVAYSLGNFVFTSPSEAGRQSMILRLGIMPDLSIVTAATPVRIALDGRPEPVPVGAIF